MRVLHLGKLWMRNDFRFGRQPFTELDQTQPFDGLSSALRPPCALDSDVILSYAPCLDSNLHSYHHLSVSL